MIPAARHLKFSLPAFALLVVTALGVSPRAVAQLEFEQEPIRYSASEPTDAVAQLSAKLTCGEVTLTREGRQGYLKSLLSTLDIPVSSQVLVFSKTSLQVSRITPQSPRAIYFADDVYVGWVPRGDVLEISAADASLGGTFYTLDQHSEKPPRIIRETAHCLQCHASSHTRRTPGHMVRSVYPDDRGLPVYRLGTHLSNDTSPFRERFGGWYVTGTHGQLRHMGNVFLQDETVSEQLDTEAGANITDLNPFLDTSTYLSPHSDLVALMVLQHQTAMHNILTAANHAGRLTARDSTVMNTALERPANFESESTARRYGSAAETVVRGLLFCGEYRLTDSVRGTSEFATDFAARGPFDGQGRSLRQFDLQTRLFRFPCSFLIYSESFRALPDGVRKLVWQRLDEILSGRDQLPAFAHLSPDDRRSLREILRATCDEMPGESNSSAPLAR